MPLTLAIVRPGRGSGLCADDGLRSTVRRLAFEPEQNVTHRLGYMIAAFTLPEAVPGYRQQDGLMLAEASRSVWDNGNVPAALRDWEEHLRPFIDCHRRSGVSMRQFFTPANRTEKLLRSVTTRLSRLPISKQLLAKLKTNCADARMKALVDGDVPGTCGGTPGGQEERQRDAGERDDSGDDEHAAVGMRLNVALHLLPQLVELQLSFLPVFHDA
jgi:hypothetical protein